MKSKGVSPVVATVLLMGIAIASVSSAAIFLQGTISDLQEGVESNIGQQNKIESSSMSIDYGYNGTNGYFLVDLRNDGSTTITVEEENEKLLNMYLDNMPKDWNYTKGSSYLSQSQVSINPTSVLTLNTTEEFPAEGNSTSVEFTGPYEVRTSYTCYSENGFCER